VSYFSKSGITSGAGLRVPSKGRGIGTFSVLNVADAGRHLPDALLLDGDAAWRRVQSGPKGVRRVGRSPYLIGMS
jgi:hypothetical protein